MFCLAQEKEEELNNPYPQRIAKCGEHMRHLGINVLLLTKPSNMYYLTGDGRLCAFTTITQDGKVALGIASPTFYPRQLIR